MRIGVMFLLLLAAPSVCEGEDGSERKDPRWWFRRADAALERVADAEARTLIGSMLQTVQGKLLSPPQAAAAVDEQLATWRTQTPADKSWQYELRAARLYESVQRYPEAVASLKRANAEIQARFEGKLRESLLTNVDYQLSESVQESIERGEVELAVEAAALIHGAPSRETKHGDISVALAQRGDLEGALAFAAKIPAGFRRDRAFTSIAEAVDARDPKLAWSILEHVAEAARPQAKRLFLIRRCSPDHPARWEAAIQRLIDDADAITDKELWKCLSVLDNGLAKVAAAPALRPEVATALEAFLKKAIEDKPRARSEAIDCLARMYFAAGRHAELLQFLEQRDQGHLLAIYQSRIALALLERNRPQEAFAVCRDMRELEPSLELIKAFVKAGAPDAALHLAKKRDEIETVGLVMTDIAEAFALDKDEQGVERSLEALAVDDLRARSLADVATRLHAKQQPAMASKYFTKATQLLTTLPADPRRTEAAQAVAAALAAVGDKEAAAAVRKKYLPRSPEMLMHLSVAETQRAAGNEAAFLASMKEFERSLTPQAVRAMALQDAPAVLPRRRSELDGPALPPLPALPPPDRAAPDTANEASKIGQMHMQLALLGVQTYLRAGKAKEAQSLLVQASSAVEGVGGTLWRIELYMELLEHFQTAEQLEQLAELAEAMKAPADKAILFTLGGAVRARLQSQPTPAAEGQTAP